ncbi:hypothetical protein LTR78_008526 [Recurvomyces mirabilis]|uniref:Uncharacterized protein n=1 Tax=Recurvomyces mirabilis TaxID=574656 RepID=A0AAE0TUL8_9PEZI|nr:hypothetical protein LTR78_008526 [Recurvomyces mirabilis]KAK5156277.1 hypothetical protein LTS14_005165 [Recurvomyces mirabilis]
MWLGSETKQLALYETKITALRTELKDSVVEFLRRKSHTATELNNAVDSLNVPIWYFCAFRPPSIGDDEWVAFDCEDADIFLMIDIVSDLFAEHNAVNVLELLISFELEDGALLAYRDGSFEPSSTTFKLFTIPKFDFGEFCIGDCINDDRTYYNEVRTVDKGKFHYFDPFATFNARKSFKLTALQRSIGTVVDDNNVGEGQAPFLPPYCFNDFVPSHLGMHPTTKDDLPKDRDRGRASLAVLCASNLGDEVSDEVKLVFPQDITFQPPVTKYIARSIRRRIEAQLQVQSAPGSKVKCAILYQAPLSGTWGIELWLMPQKPAPLKLFRFAEYDDDHGMDLTYDEAGAKSPILEFLHAPAVQKGDNRLLRDGAFRAQR